MNTIKYSYQLLILIAWGLGVGLLFATIHDRQLAGVIAGVFFILIPLIMLVSELRSAARHWYQLASVAIFLVFSALPIFCLRIFNWGTDFNELSLFGVTGPQFHKSSNILYFIMIATTAYAWYSTSRSSQKNQH